MKTFRVPLALLLITMAVRAQDAVPSESAATAPVSVLRTPEELDQLLAPIALYPDALIALILPASTVPTDIVLAARHLRDNPGDRNQIEHRAWDESVKSLTNYPEVLTWMDENLQWTRQVGEAFATQPADVMNAVQRLRAKARAAGTLTDTPQQQVIAEQQVIRIVPAQPDIIYVPRYEPEIVFVDRPVYYTRPFLTFGVGVPVGSWLAFDCDWRHNAIWVGNRHRRWTGHDWRRPLVTFAPSHHVNRNVRTIDVRKWHPPTHSVRTSVSVGHRFRSEIARPAPLGLTTSRSHTNSTSHSHSFRDSDSPRSHTSRASVSPSRRSVNVPPVVPAIPRNFSPGFRHESAGPRAATPAVVPPLPMSRANQINPRPAPMPNLQPLPQARSSSRSEGNHDFGNRSRSFRSAQPTITAPLPVVPALPRTTPARSAQPIGPTANRSFSRSVSAPAVVPALPVHNRSTRPAAVGPVAPVAPQVAPQAAPAAAPQAAPVQQRGGGGHRGAGGRRQSS